MAHEVGELDKVTYGNATPAWHGLGKTIDGLITFDQARTDTNIGKVQQSTAFFFVNPKTGQFWNSENNPPDIKNDIEDAKENGGFIPVRHQDMCRFNLRGDLPYTDNRIMLSPQGVSMKYTVIQNHEIINIAEAVRQNSDACIETCGTLKNGKIMWILMRLPGDLTIGKGDLVRRYILIYNSHDGSRSITIAATCIRVVCWNTLSAALAADCDNKVEMRHTVNVQERIAEAIVAVQKTKAIFDRDAGIYNSMASKVVDRRFVDAYLKALIPDANKNNMQVDKRRGRILQLAYGDQFGGLSADMLVNGQPTQWGLYNAVGQYLQYESRTRMADGSTDRDRAESRMFQNMMGGTQEKMRSDALGLLMRSDELIASAAEAVASN